MFSMASVFSEESNQTDGIQGSIWWTGEIDFTQIGDDMFLCDIPPCVPSLKEGYRSGQGSNVLVAARFACSRAGSFNGRWMLSVVLLE